MSNWHLFEKIANDFGVRTTMRHWKFDEDWLGSWYQKSGSCLRRVLVYLLKHEIIFNWSNECKQRRSQTQCKGNRQKMIKKCSIFVCSKFDCKEFLQSKLHIYRLECLFAVFIVTFNAENNQCVRSRPYASFLMIARPKRMFRNAIGVQKKLAMRFSDHQWK